MAFAQMNCDTMGMNDRLAALNQAGMDGPEAAELLHGYFSEAVQCGKVAEASTALDRLQKAHPWNHAIRKLRIAARLHQKDHAAAMSAVETLVAFSKPDRAMIDSALAVRDYLGPRRISEHLRGKYTISLCMIVKNEQVFLGPCLNSIKHVVDEIIVVDTGSSDHTSDIARIYGAHVSDFKWCDDFSAARNAAIERARGEWILILDADEIIAPRDHDLLKKLVGQGEGENTAFSFQTRNYSNLANTLDWQANEGDYQAHEAGLGWFPTDKVRLFPRNRRIRFVYPVHELVDPSVRSTGMAIDRCSIPIHHYGHLNETRNARKAQHYFELGYAKLEQLGADRVALRELAIQAGQLEKWTEAIALWERLIELSPDSAEAHANMAGAYWQLGAHDKGVLFSQKAIDAQPGLKEGHYNLAANLMMDGQAAEAVRILKGLLLRHPHYLAAGFMLGVALSLNDDVERSRSIFRDLEKRISRQALTIAVVDMMEKLNNSGLEEGIQPLRSAAGMDHVDGSENGETV